MITLFIVRDTVIDADIFPFVAMSSEDAVKHFYQFCDDMDSEDFALFSIANFEYDDMGSDVYPRDISRQLVFEFRKEDSQNENSQPV